jgi:hypothetical protein
VTFTAAVTSSVGAPPDGEAFPHTDLDRMVHGNDWARGFMRGMGMRHDGWAELVNDEERGGCMVPVFMLYHEHDEDPEMRTKPISPEKREEGIVLIGSLSYRRTSNRHISPIRNGPGPCLLSGRIYRPFSHQVFRLFRIVPSGAAH